MWIDEYSNSVVLNDEELRLYSNFREHFYSKRKDDDSLKKAVAFGGLAGVSTGLAGALTADTKRTNNHSNVSSRISKASDESYNEYMRKSAELRDKYDTIRRERAAKRPKLSSNPTLKEVSDKLSQATDRLREGLKLIDEEDAAHDLIMKKYYEHDRAAIDKAYDRMKKVVEKDYKKGLRKSAKIGIGVGLGTGALYYTGSKLKKKRKKD